MMSVLFARNFASLLLSFYLSQLLIIQTSRKVKSQEKFAFRCYAHFLFLLSQEILPWIRMMQFLLVKERTCKMSCKFLPSGIYST